MPEGLPYHAPKLIKRADKTPAYFFFCTQCQTEVDGYVIADIDHPTECMSLNVYCHGDGVHIGIQDVKGFREMMAPHQYIEGQPHPQPYKLFHPNDFKVDHGHTVDDFVPPVDDPTSL